MILKIAYRNLWRNKRRTLITVSSIFFAVILSIAMKSMQDGTYDNMIQNAVKYMTGHIQIHKNGYWNDKNINNSFELSPILMSKFTSYKPIESLSPRLESYALCASETQSKSTAVIGVIPEEEEQLTHISKKIKHGRYLKNNDNGIVVGQGLADYFKLKVGDTVVLIGQGYHGASANGKYAIIGTIDIPNPNMSKSVIYMPLALAQELYSTGNRVTSLVISIRDLVDLDAVQENLVADFGKDYEVMNWSELIPELVDMMNSDKQSNMIFLGILYLVVGFGIYGTLLMMITERKKEFGILMAIGMQKSYIAKTLLIETFLLGLLSILVSFFAGYLLLFYLSISPIMLTGDMAKSYIQFNLEPKIIFKNSFDIYYSQGITIFALLAVTVIYPLIKALKYSPKDAMRG